MTFQLVTYHVEKYVIIILFSKKHFCHTAGIKKENFMSVCYENLDENWISRTCITFLWNSVSSTHHQTNNIYP